MKKTALPKFFLVAATLMFIACSKENPKPIKTQQVRKAKVIVTVAKKKNFIPEYHYAGSLAEGSATAVSFATPGTIKTLNVSEGKKISKGTLIGTLDDTAARNALEIAQATKKQAEDAHARMEKLYKNKSISEIQWMDVESKYQQATAAEKIAQKALDDCKLIAPATGIVSGKKVEVGQNVLPGIPVFNIVDISTIKATAFIPEAEINAIKIGNKVTIQVKAIGEKTYEGKITNRQIDADMLSRSYKVEADLKNKNGELLPGMIIDMTVQTKDSLSGFTLPTSAILLDEQNTPFIWKISNGKATRVNVTTSVETNLSGNEIIVQGINDGDTIVVQGSNKIGQGDFVETGF